MAISQEQPVAARPARASAPALRRLLSNFLLRRVLKALFTIWLMASITFILIRLIPGSPVDVYISNLVLQYQIPYIEARQQAASLFSLDLDAPLGQQYFEYLSNLVQGISAPRWSRAARPSARSSCDTCRGLYSASAQR
ncbi:MAG: hypothetical protein WKH64_11165 [Chloroflexia bacterium]